VADLGCVRQVNHVGDEVGLRRLGRLVVQFRLPGSFTVLPVAAPAPPSASTPAPLAMGFAMGLGMGLGMGLALGLALGFPIVFAMKLGMGFAIGLAMGLMALGSFCVLACFVLRSQRFFVGSDRFLDIFADGLAQSDNRLVIDRRFAAALAAAAAAPPAPAS
jgi:hypothetical protein